MERSRQRILRIIQHSGAATVESLAKQLALAPATVRRHLDILQRDSLVTFVEVRKPTGRPEYSFTLTDRGHEAMPKSYAPLMLDTLRVIGARTHGQLDGKSGGEVLQAVFQEMGRKAAARWSGGPGRTRAESISAVLAEHGFAPEVTQGKSGLHMKLANCPFRAVAMGDPSVCEFDSNLIEGVLGMPVTRDSCIAKGDSCCVYSAPGRGAAAGKA